MIREALCMKCHDEFAEVDAAGRCKVCGSKISETDKEFNKKQAIARVAAKARVKAEKAEKKRIAEEEEAERKAKQEEKEKEEAKSKAVEKEKSQEDTK